jgi:hypothetical protein
MKKPSRRQFITGIGAAALGITAASIGYLASGNPITSEEYKAAERTLYNLEHEVDQDHSTFREGSDSLVIYLPDVHRHYYQKDQRHRIQSIDQNMKLDVIGLEGITGDVDPAKVKRLVEKSEENWNKNTIHTILLKRNPKGFDYNVLDTDSPEIRLQKLEIAYNQSMDWAYNGTWSNPTFKKDRDKENDRYKANLEFELSTGQLFVIIPSKENKRFREISPVVQFMAMKEFQGSNPRLTAPGIPYSNLETRATKIGMENPSNDSKSSDMLDAYILQLDISRMKHQLGKTNKLFREAKKLYDGVGTLEEQARTNKRNKAYETLANELGSYKREMIQYRNKLLKGISPETKKAILDCKFNPDGFEDTLEFQPPEYEQLVIAQRSQDWINNLSNHRTSMLIGGLGHTETITQAAQDKNVSIISLTKLD